MKKYVIGVDGGGTKSHLAIFDENGNKVDFRTYGTLNHECMDGAFEQLERELGAFLRGALRENGIGTGQVEYSVFGLAGVDTKKQHQAVSGILRRLGFDKFMLYNDAYLGIPAGSPDGTGICAINGTGCTVAGIGADGRAMQIGGLGGISEDLGGGAQMGKTAAGRVYRSLFRCGEPTAMTDMMFELLGITSKYDFAEAFTEKYQSKELDISLFNRLLFEAAGIGDKAALEILEAVAENYAGAIGCLFDELDFPKDKETRIVFAGSVFVKAEHPVLLDTVKKLAEGRDPGRKIKYTLLEKPPVMGAVVEAFNRTGRGGLAPKARGQF